MTTDLITLIANIALTLSFIAALIFGIAQTRAAARDRRERLTLDTLSKFQTQEFCELMFYVTIKSLPGHRDEMRALPEKDQVKIMQFAQTMESLGILVAEGLVDIDLVDKTLGNLVTNAWEQYRPMFTDIRITAPDPFLGEYFQWLAAQIDRRMKEHPRKPFFEQKKA